MAQSIRVVGIGPCQEWKSSAVLFHTMFRHLSLCHCCKEEGSRKGKLSCEQQSTHSCGYCLSFIDTREWGGKGELRINKKYINKSTVEGCLFFTQEIGSFHFQFLQILKLSLVYTSMQKCWAAIGMVKFIFRETVIFRGRLIFLQNFE